MAYFLRIDKIWFIYPLVESNFLLEQKSPEKEDIYWEINLNINSFFDSIILKENNLVSNSAKIQSILLNLSWDSTEVWNGENISSDENFS